MKLQTILAALLLTSVSALSFGAYAADADKTPAGAAMPMTPHSHMQEKTGVAPPQKSSATAADEKSATPKAGKRKTKHFHPRDGK